PQRNNMLTKVLSVLAVMGLTLADQPPQQDPYGNNNKPVGMPYDFAYGVKDDYRGLDFDQSENSDGNVVQGGYNVVLPDGRIQTVTYEADHDNGFRSNVEYIGEAQFPKEFAPPVTFKPQASYQKPQKQQSYQPPQQQQQSYQPPQQAGYGK
ncbi:unnamed protein product, partial [Meganyctiphanes norvegica]